MDRIIFDDNGTLKDLSVSLEKFTEAIEVVGIVGADDALYLGSNLPFNHRYLYFSTPNDEACVIASIAVWDGKEFLNAVDVIDETESGGKTFAQSGKISWTPSKHEGWAREDTNNNGHEITGLSTLTIYDLYWLKITFTGTMNVATAIKFIGYKFAEDIDLEMEYPELMNPQVINAFKTGKTNWDEQQFVAAEKIINALKERNIILSRNQILTSSRFKEAAVHKLAQIIFNSFGDAYKDNTKKAEIDFNKALKFKTFDIDQDNDARLDPRERVATTGWMKR